MSKVTVIAHPETGNVITPSSNNPEYGTFRVDSIDKSLENGFVNINKRSAFIRGRITDLSSLDLKAGQTLPGKIQKQESFDPFYDGQEPKINPTTNEVVLTDGKETYLQFEYTANAKALDIWVDNSAPVEQTQDAQEQLEEQQM